MASRPIADRTRRAYSQDVAHFGTYCKETGLTGPLPASPDAIARYLDAMAETYAASTLARRTRAIVHAHRAAGLDLQLDPITIRRTIRLGTPLQRAPVLGTTEVRALIDTCPADSLTGKRDRAMLLLAFAGALRRSELVGINREDLTIYPDEIRIAIGASVIVIPRGAHVPTCPLRALLEWLDAALIHRGAVFRGVDRWGTIAKRALNSDGVRRILVRAAIRAGLPDASPHGLRAGCVIQAYRGGAEVASIRQHTRHKSLRTYLRRSNNLSDHPARLLGL